MAFDYKKEYKEFYLPPKAPGIIEILAEMERYMWENGLTADISGCRFYHEIYLSDPRRCAPEKLRTVIRHPVKKI